MTTLEKPKYLYIPELYEESTADISWESTDSAQGYELEAVFDQTFDQAMHGKSWQDLNLMGNNWAAVQTSGAESWQAFSRLPAQGLTWENLAFFGKTWAEINADSRYTWRWLWELPVFFVVYRGEGVRAQAPDQGYAWQTVNHAGMSWQSINDRGKDWASFHHTTSRGRSWAQLQWEGHCWEELSTLGDGSGPTWLHMAWVPARGLSWLSLNALQLSWQERHTAQKTWEDLIHAKTADRDLASCKVTLPLYRKQVMLRVRAYGDELGYSDHLTSDLLRLKPRSLAKDTPPCLHVPTLYETESVSILWGELYGASDYVLERSVNGGAFEIVYDGAGTAATDQPEPKLSHRSCTVRIPAGAKTVSYRIKAYNTTDASKYLTLGKAAVIPVFHREEVKRFPVLQGREYWLQFNARDISDFAGVGVTLEYNPAVLSVSGDIRVQAGFGMALNRVPELTAGVLSHSAGALRFAPVRQGNPGRNIDGMVCSIRCKALASSTAEVRIY